MAKTNPETIMYLVGYDSKFKQACNTGWGCGYLLIPMNHPIIEEQWDPQSGYAYLQIPDFSEELTLAQRATVNNIEYLLVGFDTAHSWNTPDEHTFTWCLNKTSEMKSIVDNYKLLEIGSSDDEPLQIDLK